MASSSHIERFGLAVCLLFVAGACLLQIPRPATTVSDQLPVGRTIGPAPPSFEENIGQADSSAAFLTAASGVPLRLTADGGLASLRTTSGTTSTARMRLAGGNPTPEAETLEPLAQRTHYFIGNDSSAWRTNVPHYGRVRYQQVYPGIDLDYYHDGEQLEYDFIVAPGADPSLIQLSFDGVGHLTQDRRGDLVLRTAAGEVRHQRPFVYQEVGGRRQEVSSRYVLSKARTVLFDVAKYDPALPLVIDPKLVVSSYIGGRGQDFGAAVASGPDNSVWVAGATQSTNLPVPPGQSRPSLPGLRATFLNKYDQEIDADGRTSRVLSETIFLGGTAGDLPDSIPVGLEVDAAGNLYVLGETTTSDFPLTNDPYQRIFRGARDMYVTVIAPSGSGGLAALSAEREQADAPRLLYSSYVGGQDVEVPTDTALGNCPAPIDGPCFFFTGYTSSRNLEVTPNAPQSIVGGFEDPVVGILGPDLTTSGDIDIRYLAVLGGSGRDTNPQILALDSGAFCLGMTTTSDNLPVPAEVLERAMHPTRLAEEDGFIMRTAVASTAALHGPEQGDRDPFGLLEVERATYVRGPGRDQQDRMELLNLAESFGFRPAPDLPLDDLKEVVLAVIDSNSDQLPVRPVVEFGDPFFPTNPGGQSAYVLVMNRNLTVPLAGGWLGGSGEDETTGVITLGKDFTIFANTNSPDWPGAVNSFSGGRWDGLTVYIENFQEVVADSLTEAAGGADSFRELLLREFPFDPGGLPNTVGPDFDRETTYWGGPGRDEFNSARAELAHFYGGGITDSDRSDFQQFPVSKGLQQQSSPGFPITRGAPQERYGGGPFDGFLMEFFQPVLERRAILGAASFLERDVAPGQIITLFSGAIGPPGVIELGFNDQGKLLTQLGLTRILFDGEAAPMVFTSRNQASAIAPFSLKGKETSKVQVEFDGTASNAITMAVADSSPGIFSVNQSGMGQGAILHPDFSLNGPDNPVAPGGAVLIFLTGGGQTDPPGADGELAPLTPPFPEFVEPVSVTIGGLDAQVLYGGAAPGLIHGVGQINVLVSEDVAPGEAVPVEVMIGENTSQPGITVAVGTAQ